MDEELKLKNLQLYQQALLDNQNNSNELIVVPLYKEDGTMGFKLMPNKKEAMELGANDPLFLALTAGTSAGKLALKGAYSLGVKGFTKLQPYLNIMSPGTKEFMTMLNSGIPGKIASGAVTAAEGYWINEAIKQAKENPNIGNIAMAGLSVLPYTNGAAQAVTNGWFNLAKNSKPLLNLTFSAVGAWDGLMDNINQIGLNIKKAGVKFDKWWNADKRIYEVLDKSINQSKYFSNQAKNLGQKSQDIINKIQPLKFQKFDLKNKFEDLRDYSSYIVRPLINTSSYVSQRFNRPKLNEFYTYEVNLPSGAKSKVGRRGSSKYKWGEIDFNKLSEEDIMRLALFNQLRASSFDFFRPSSKSPDFKTQFSEFKKAFTLSKDQNGNYIITSNVSPTQIVGTHPYTPEQFVNTQYNLGSFSDPSKPLINGEIKFGGGSDGTVNITKPFVNLQTGRITESIIPDFSELNPNKLIYLDPEYRKLFAENMAFVEQKIPGFVPYGSSVGLVDVGLPHSAGDIDGYMKVSDWESFLKKNPGLKFEDKGDLKSIVFNEQMGKNGIVDINLIHSDKDGFVEGERGILLARMFFPNIYSLWNLYGRKGPLKVKVDDVMKAASELRAAKTVADAFEINPLNIGKDKHLGRPFVYLSSGDPEQVAKGLELYGKSFGVTSGFPVTLDELTDIERNKKILRDLKMPVSIEEVASNPLKMKNTLDYWYINQTVRGRGVDLSDPQLITNSLTQQWNPKTNTGGTAMGAGRNSVVFGNSGYGPMYGFLQLQPKTPLTGNVEDKIKQIKRFTGMWDYEFTPDEISQMQNIGNRFGLNLNTHLLKNSQELLNSIPSNEEGALFLNTLSDEMGIQALTRSNSYENVGTKYSSILEDSSQTPLMIYNTTNNSDYKLIDLLNLFGRNEKLKPIDPISLKPIYKKLNLIGLDIRFSKVGDDMRRELDTPLAIKIPWKRYVETKLKKSGQFEEYQNRVKDAEIAYLENQNKINSLKNLLSETQRQKSKFYSLARDADRKFNNLNWNYKRKIKDIKFRKNLLKSTPLILGGAAASAYGINHIYDDIKEAKDISKWTDEELLRAYRSSKTRFEKSGSNERFFRSLQQELKNRGLKY